MIMIIPAWLTNNDDVNNNTNDNSNNIDDNNKNLMHKIFFLLLLLLQLTITTSTSSRMARLNSNTYLKHNNFKKANEFSLLSTNILGIICCL